MELFPELFLVGLVVPPLVALFILLEGLILFPSLETATRERSVKRGQWKGGPQDEGVSTASLPLFPFRFYLYQSLNTYYGRACRIFPLIRLSSYAGYASGVV